MHAQEPLQVNFGCNGHPSPYLMTSVLCKLVKSLYGLKQASKQWYEKFDNVILSHDFKHNNADKCLYSKFTNDFGVIICLYVDYLLIF